MARPRWAPTLLLAALAAGGTTGCVTGCTAVVGGHAVGPPPASVDESLIAAYFEHSNEAAREGADAQTQFLERTQHPDVERLCDLDGLTLLLDPTLSTLRRDEGWRPSGTSGSPRGRVYVVAVTVTVQRGQSTLGTQVGSMHVAVLDGTAYGFAPCPN